MTHNWYVVYDSSHGLYIAELVWLRESIDVSMFKKSIPVFDSPQFIEQIPEYLKSKYRNVTSTQE